MIKTEDMDKILLPKGAIAKEIKIWMSRKDLRQKWLAATLGITVPSVSDKLKGVTPFTTDELMTIAGALGLSLSELLGEELEFDLADTVIHHRNVYAQALSEGLSVVESDNSKAKAEIQLLTQEITRL